MITSPRWRPPAFSVPHPVTGTGTTCLSRHRTMGPRILPSTPPGSGDRIMSVPRLRQSMSYSLWFSISAFILDLSSCPPPFRAWTGRGNAGGYNAPGLPNIQGVSGGDNCLTTHVLSIGSVWTGPLRVGYNLESAGEVYERRANPYEGLYGGMQFDASRANAIYGASQTVMPASINLSVILYLGNSA